MVAQPAPGNGSPQKLRVFISYSRHDIEFVQRLADALAGRGYEPDFDLAVYDPQNISSGISAEDEWWQRIQQLIIAAEVMIFVVSPASAASRVCDEEIAYARELGKRIVPILRTTLDLAKAPPRLSALNVDLDFRDDAAFEQALDKIVEVLNLNVGWHRVHNRYIARAEEWMRLDRKRDTLLYGDQISEARQWLARPPPKQAETSQLVRNYVAASEAAEGERLELERARLQQIARAQNARARWQRISFGGLALGLAVLVAIASGVYQFWRETSLNRSEFIASLAAEKLSDGRVAEATLLALEAVPAPASLNLSRRFQPPSPPGAAILRTALRAWRQNPDISVKQVGRGTVTLSGDGSQFAYVADGERTIGIFDTTTNRQVRLLEPDAVLGDPLGAPLIAFAADKSRVASTWKLSTIHLWNLKNGKLIRPLAGDNLAIKALAFSPDGTQLASAGSDNTVRLWSGVTGASLRTTLSGGHTNWVNAVSYAPDGTRLATASADKTIRLWNPKTGELQPPVLASQGSTGTILTFAPDGSRLAAGDKFRDGVSLWDPETGTRIVLLSGFHGPIAFSRSGSRLAVVRSDYAIGLMDAVTGEKLDLLKGHRSFVKSVAFSRDGKRVLSASDDKTIRIWDAASATELARLKGHDQYVETARFSTDATRVISRSGDGSIFSWDVSKLGERRDVSEIQGAREAINALAFSPDGRWLAAASDDKSIRLWDAKTGARVTAFTGHTSKVTSVSFSPDGKRLVSGSFDKTIRIWDIQSGRHTVLLPKHGYGVVSARFSPDGRIIASASQENVIRLWNADSGAPVDQLERHSGGVIAIAFAPDGSTLASASHDHTVRLWDLAKRQEIVALAHKATVSAVAFSPDGSKLASASNDNQGGHVRVWDVPSMNELGSLAHKSWLSAIAFDGNTHLATAAQDNTIRIWDSLTGHQFVSWKAHSKAILSLSFAPDGRRLASGSRSGMIRLWRPLKSIANALADARRSVPYCLTKAQRQQFRLSPEPASWCYDLDKYPFSRSEKPAISSLEWLVSMTLGTGR